METPNYELVERWMIDTYVAAWHANVAGRRFDETRGSDEQLGLS